MQLEPGSPLVRNTTHEKVAEKSSCMHWLRIKKSLKHDSGNWISRRSRSWKMRSQKNYKSLPLCTQDLCKSSFIKSTSNIKSELPAFDPKNFAWLLPFCVEHTLASIDLLGKLNCARLFHPSCQYFLSNASSCAPRRCNSAGVLLPPRRLWVEKHGVILFLKKCMSNHFCLCTFQKIVFFQNSHCFLVLGVYRHY